MHAVTEAGVPTRIRYVNESSRELAGIPRLSSGEERRSNTSFHDVRVLDARPLQDRGELDLDTHGFILQSHKTEVDFSDRDPVLTDYFEEMCTLVQSLSGADAVLPLDHLIRFEGPGAIGQTPTRATCTSTSVRACRTSGSG